jgi:hypothetical protein
VNRAAIEIFLESAVPVSSCPLLYSTMTEFELNKTYTAYKPRKQEVTVIWIDEGLAELHYKLEGEAVSLRARL